MGKHLCNNWVISVVACLIGNCNIYTPSNLAGILKLLLVATFLTENVELKWCTN